MTNVLQTWIPHAVESADIGLTYRNGILDWETSVSMSDACFGNETVNTPRGQEPHHSQQGRITMLVSPEVWKEDKAGMHIIGWNSTTIKRVCRSMLQAEPFATLGAVEEGMRVRALIFNLCCQATEQMRSWVSCCLTLSCHAICELHRANAICKL